MSVSAPPLRGVVETLFLCRGFDRQAISVGKSCRCNFLKLARPAGLLGATRLALRVALKGDRRRCAASSNRFLSVVGST